MRHGRPRRGRRTHPVRRGRWSPTRRTPREVGHRPEIIVGDDESAVQLVAPQANVAGSVSMFQPSPAIATRRPPANGRCQDGVIPPHVPPDAYVRRIESYTSTYPRHMASAENFSACRRHRSGSISSMRFVASIISLTSSHTKPGLPSLEDLGHRSVAERDDGRARGQRLDHHQAERFRPVDREQRGRGAREELGLLGLADLADELDVRRRAEQRRRCSVVVHVERVDLGRDLAAVARPAGHLDGPVGPFLLGVIRPTNAR